MNWRKEKNKLILEMGKSVSFDFPIKCINEITDVLIVQLDVPAKDSKTENLFYVSKQDGTIRSKEILPNTELYSIVTNEYTGLPQKCMMDWAKEDNDLILENSKRVSFDCPIRSVLETSGIIVVLLHIPAGKIMTENVFGISGEGKVIWQIERIPETATDPLNRYVALWDNTPGVALACNWNCTNAYVDVKTGKVIDTKFTK